MGLLGATQIQTIADQSSWSASVTQNQGENFSLSVHQSLPCALAILLVLGYQRMGTGETQGAKITNIAWKPGVVVT